MRWLLGFFYLSTILADPSEIPDGAASQGSKKAYGAETLESVELLGTLKLNGTTISRILKITGNLISSSATLNEVEATGDVRLIDTTIAKKIQVIGSLNASGSTFEQPLSFLGQRAVFSGCQLPGITIEKDTAFKGKRIIELKNKTQVDGPIQFIGGGGKIILYSGSRVTGAVSGAQIIKKG